eukprot:Gb_38208 [translate_table: standard]
MIVAILAKGGVMGYPYITVVLNFSQMWALYCLVQFYAVTHDELREIKPLAKFISFKAIVFATWWQGVAIAIICSPSILADAFPDGQTFQSGLQDFLICIEIKIVFCNAAMISSSVIKCHSIKLNQKLHLNVPETQLLLWDDVFFYLLVSFSCHAKSVYSLQIMNSSYIKGQWQEWIYVFIGGSSL